MNISIALATMLALWIFSEIFLNPGNQCPVCGGRKSHGSNCPNRKDDE
jgi:hypothetical protein